MSREPVALERDERFGSRDRLLQREQFQDCYRKGQRLSRHFVNVHVRANDEGRARLGITASRKVGKAHVRQRTKRRLREIFRRWPERNGLPAVDIVLHVKPHAGAADFEALRRDVASALRLVRSGELKREGRSRRRRS
ncbi:MAG: ribonuclease P protein component [Acidobacteriota bacterium]